MISAADQVRRVDMNDGKKRVYLMFSAILLVAPAAFSQSDEELLEKVHANAVKIYLEQASFTLPESFHNSGLALQTRRGSSINGPTILLGAIRTGLRRTLPQTM